MAKDENFKNKDEELEYYKIQSKELAEKVKISTEQNINELLLQHTEDVGENPKSSIRNSIRISKIASIGTLVASTAASLVYVGKSSKDDSSSEKLIKPFIVLGIGLGCAIVENIIHNAGLKNHAKYDEALNDIKRVAKSRNYAEDVHEVDEDVKDIAHSNGYDEGYAVGKTKGSKLDDDARVELIKTGINLAKDSKMSVNYRGISDYIVDMLKK